MKKIFTKSESTKRARISRMRWQDSHPEEHRKICRQWHVKNWERVLLNKNKNEARLASEIKKRLVNGWPDVTVGREWIEIKRGRDSLKAVQIARFNWLEREFGILVKIYWYPNSGRLKHRWNHPAIRKAHLIKFHDWKSWVRFLQKVVYK